MKSLGELGRFRNSCQKPKCKYIPNEMKLGWTVLKQLPFCETIFRWRKSDNSIVIIRADLMIKMGKFGMMQTDWM